MRMIDGDDFTGLPSTEACRAQLHEKSQLFVSAYDGVFHVYAILFGTGPGDALRQADLVLDYFARDYRTFIRIAPEETTERDFDTQEMQYRGHVRFSVHRSIKGPRTPIDAPEDVVAA